MSEQVQTLKPLKTWSHLAKNRRRPSEYEIVSTNLLWNQNEDTPPELGQGGDIHCWNNKYRHLSPLKHSDWDAFRDPDEVVYRTYNIMQDGQETYVDNLLDEYNELEHDISLNKEWLVLLSKLYTPARYVLHCSQMMAAYGATMAQSSTIANVWEFQSADAFRLVSNIAYRTCELSKVHPELGFDKTERMHWENSPCWQGFRELMEKALVAYDSGESFVALNLIAKPAIDEAILREMVRLARQNGDELFALLVDSHLRDSDRSRRWSKAFTEFVTEEEGNRAVIQGWIDKWLPLADAAIDAYCAEMPEGKQAAESAKGRTHAFLAELGYA